jgi:hypothetical protein
MQRLIHTNPSPPPNAAYLSLQISAALAQLIVLSPAHAETLYDAIRDSGGPSSGDPDSPKDIWATEGTKNPKQRGGFQLALTLDGKRLATIPIAGDCLVPSRAIAGRDTYVSAR